MTVALKGDRAVYITNIRHICDTTGEAGTLMQLKASQPTGRAVGQGINDSAPVAVPVTGTPASGIRVLGVLLDDVKGIDPVTQHRNFQRTDQLVGENVCILTDGFVRTNKITGTPSAGDTAYVGANGTFSASQTNSIPAVGKFETSKDTDGFAIVVVKIP